MLYAINFTLSDDFWKKTEDQVDMAIQIQNILKLTGFEQKSKSDLYISKTSNAVLTVLTAQRLCKLNNFSKNVSNFNMFRIDEMSSLAPLTKN